jgi:PST family polysaccharide transporter
VAILGAVALLEAVSSGQKALLQGLRRVGDIARIQIAAAVLTTLLAVGIYAWLREDGIVPVIILTSLVQLSCSWFFARRVGVQEVPQPWQETWRNFGQLFKLGSALMYGAVLTAMAGLAIRALMVRDLGLEAAGLYQAAWTLSGMFGAIVLQALATDFYPRLTEVSQNSTAMNRLINEQIEVGMLLALPGVSAAIAFAPWLIQLLYSTKFTMAAELLPWLVIGVFGQVVTWPLGMVMQAKAATGWLYFNRTHNAIVQLVCTAGLISMMGLLGAALGYLLYIVWQGLLALYIARRLTRFRVSREMQRVFWLCLGAISISVILGVRSQQLWVALVSGAFVGAVLLGACSELRKRLPDGSRLNRFLRKAFPPSKLWFHRK